MSHNVGTKCAESDVAVDPSSSTPDKPAAFRWTKAFGLKPGSPAIGVCDPALAPKTDAAGTPRGDRCDAGAYEASSQPDGDS